MTRPSLVAAVILFALTIGMSVYVSELRRREAARHHARPSTSLERIAPPRAAGQVEKVTVFVAYDDPGELRARSISVPLASVRQQRAEALLEALIGIYTAKDSPHPLSAGADVRDVFLVDPGLAVIDLNSALADGQVSGVLAEGLTIASMIQTLSSNLPGLSRVKFLVDGKERDTLAGHADLAGFYEVSEVARLAAQLSAHQ
ncbi:MAG: GerMN domain-containing protein [Acidobacteria bacterium]|nr:GerMN domain-containing protein [Acidobacteriota bacterium]